MIRTVPGSEKYFNSRLTLPSRIIRAGFRIADNYMDLSDYGPFNITLSREKRFLWFRVPKAATTSTMLFLRKTGVQLDAEYAKNSYYLPALYQSWFKFSFVRNPWSRLVSAWQNKVVNTNLFDFPPGERERMLQFEYFVKEFVASQDLATCDPHLRRQTRLIPIQDMDFIGRQESYDLDLAIVTKQLNLPSFPQRPVNASRKREKYTDYYTPQLKNLVGDWYADDVKNFNYDY